MVYLSGMGYSWLACFHSRQQAHLSALVDSLDNVLYTLPLARDDACLGLAILGAIFHAILAPSSAWRLTSSLHRCVPGMHHYFAPRRATGGGGIIRDEGARNRIAGNVPGKVECLHVLDSKYGRPLQPLPSQIGDQYLITAVAPVRPRQLTPAWGAGRGRCACCAGSQRPTLMGNIKADDR